MAEPRGLHQLTVDVDDTGRYLRLTGADTGAIRLALSAAGVHFRQRAQLGGVVADVWEGVKLLDSDLPLEWTPTARGLVDNRVAVSRALKDVRAAYTMIPASGAQESRALIIDGRLTNLLDDHQAMNVAMLTTPGTWGGCVFDEQGTGKTVTLIAAFDVLVERGLTDTMLVVAPKSMVGEWRREFGRFTGDLYRVVIAEGDRRAKAAALFSGADVVVINFETLVALDDDIVRLARRTRLTLTIDESFNVKNPEASRTRAASKLREWCTHAFVLCGTPAPNAASDIVAQFDLVDFGYTFRGLILDKDKKVAARQVSDRLAERGMFVRNVKSDVLPDLPARSFTEIDVDLAPQQRAAYDAALNDLVLDLQRIDDHSFAREIQSYLERRAALLRICADPSPIIPGYTETPAKIDALDDLLHHLIGDLEEKVVIWSFYRASLDRIADRYAHMGLVRIDGSVIDATDRREAVRRFQEDQNVFIFLGNPAAAGAGLTLHSARYAVYESLSNQAAHYLQSLDRIHRRGQQRDVRYVTLVARGTVEEVEYQRLRDKATAQADLLGDPALDVPTRRLMLAELLATRQVDQ
ncbi:DEAD/DEAH box helicase [Nocardia caishijiensis]|uniref:Helicase-like protein n=1 Tax=Nocardia caishijiensis TaxID=184756 RepID=A0ABQ6YRL6_9NOCA|nr:DEAD/DEAH box helicase [Nocardia caishijiensis]KAF0848141.1 helicase-like protein [Nocardia caishijiensis]